MTEGDGNGWVRLPDGTYRWGLHGAAGLLMHAPDRDGAQHVLLQHRAAWSHQGDTWGLPGGALDSGETSVVAALREFGEEVAGTLGTLDVTAIHRAVAGPWHYDTVIAGAPAMGDFTAGNSESEEIRWVRADQVPDLALLPAFGKAWPFLLRCMPTRLDLVVDADAVLARTGGQGPQALAGLRDALALLADSGIAAEALPGVMALPPLHLWFPRIRLVTAEDVAPVPGVTVAHGAASADAAGAAVAAGSNGAAAVLAVSDRTDDATGAMGGAVGPDWLLEKAGLAPIVHCA